MSARACQVAAFITTLALGAALSSSCNLENPGDEAPVGALYFPNALAISNEADTAPRFLFVASTNFDLRFRSGALHALSLDAIDEAIETCAEDDKLGAETCPIEVLDVLADEVLIPTYATALALDPDGTRLVVASRTEDRLMTINVNLDAEDAALVEGSNPIASDLLGCEAPASRGCGTGTINDIDIVSAEALGQPEAPSDLVIGRLSDLTGDPDDEQRDYVAIAHQRGAVSLYIDEDDGDDSLKLTSVADGLGRTPTGIARDPVSGLFHVSLLGNQLLRLGVTFDSEGEFEGRARLFNATSLAIAGASLGQLRSIAFLDEPVGLGVGEGESQALIVANVPSALVLANVTPGASSTTTGRVQRVAEIGAGGTKLALGSVGGRPVAAVSCLEGRSIYIVDLTSMETRAVVPNLSGPFGVAFDEARGRLYVTDFRSSVLRVVDLSQLASPDAAPESVRVVATVGRPRVVQELK